jgi:hypothetical protein
MNFSRRASKVIIQAKKARDQMLQAGFSMKDFYVRTAKHARWDKTRKKTYYEYGNALIMMRGSNYKELIEKNWDKILEVGLGIYVFEFAEGKKHYSIRTDYRLEGRVEYYKCYRENEEN